MTSPSRPRASSSPSTSGHARSVGGVPVSTPPENVLPADRMSATPAPPPPQPQPVRPTAAGVGLQLHDARTALNLTIRQVTERTKMQPWVLEALEASRLPANLSPVYARGFLVSYAKFLRLDPAPLVAALFPAKDAGSSAASPASRSVHVEPSVARASAEIARAAAARAATSAVRPKPPVSVTANRPPVSLTPLLTRLAAVKPKLRMPKLTLPRLQMPSWGWPALGVAARAAVGIAIVVVVVKFNPLRWGSTKAPHREASVAVAVPKLPPPPAATPRASAPKAVAPAPVAVEPAKAPPLQLTISARRATWIRVMADGRLMTQRQLARGAQETWKAKKGFELVIAKPLHVDVSVNGKSITAPLVAAQGRASITHKGVAPLAASR